MKPDDWAVAKQLLGEAAGRPAGERERYVVERCGDPDLRREILSLLAAPAALTDIVNAGALAPGTRLASYVLEERIGAGGMGEVYRARDVRLGRQVAIKVLPAAIAGDPDSLARFEREARLLASLSHPNICTLFDVGRDGDVSFIAMELLEGGTLGERIAAQPLPTTELLDLGIQIADALHAIHERGIIHRDIKPSNIFVTCRGQAKVLDAGLAKLQRPSGAPAGVAAASVTERSITGTGTTIGTAAYMSPEQARGESLDARTDLFSFGAVLYEMASGRRAFPAASVAAVFADLLNTSPPPVATLNPNLPRSLDRVITKALEKDRAARYQTAAELRADLTQIRDEAGTVVRAAAPRRARWVAAAAVVALIAAGAGVGLRFRKAAPTTSGEWTQLTTFPDSAVQPALSSDGRMLTFIRGPLHVLTSGQIYVKLLPSGEARELTHDDRLKMGPVFSPDNSHITYTVPWDTWTVPVLGGASSVLLPNTSGLTWIDAEHALYSERQRDSSMGISVSTGSRTDHRTVYQPAERGESAHRSVISPDRAWVVIAARMNVAGALHQPCLLVAVDGRAAPREIGGNDSACLDAAWSPDGRWIYLELVNRRTNNTHIWRQRFPDGALEQVTAGPTVEHGIAVAPDGRSLITSAGSTRYAVWVHDAAGDRPVSSEGFAGTSPSPFTRDGTRLFFLVDSASTNGANELWVADIHNGTTERALPGVSGLDDYSISEDGRLVAFVMRSSATGGAGELWVAPLDRSAPPRRLTPAEPFHAFFGASHDLYFTRKEADGTRSAFRMDCDTGAESRVVAGPLINIVAVSPDREWAAIVVDRDNARLTVARSTVNGREIPLCAECAGRWSADGRYLFLWYPGSGQDKTVYVLPVAPGGVVPGILASGAKTGGELAAAVPTIAGARAIVHHGEGGISLAPNPDIYAYQRANTQRNLYRVPIH